MGGKRGRTMPRPETLIDGLCFPEGPRWHDGRLWFSDMHDQQVLAVDPDGEVETIVDPVNIFDREAFKHEVEKFSTPEAKAEVIKNRLRRTIHERLDEDPVFYRQLSELLQETYDKYHQERFDQLLLLQQVEGLPLPEEEACRKNDQIIMKLSGGYRSGCGSSGGSSRGSNGGDGSDSSGITSGECRTRKILYLNALPHGQECLELSLAFT